MTYAATEINTKLTNFIPFNPNKRYTFAPVYNWILSRKELTANAKIVYGRLVQYADDDGVAYPKVATLATECGLGKRTCERAIKELKDHNLIKSFISILDKTCAYLFLSHPWMNDSVSEKTITELSKRYYSDNHSRSANDEVHDDSHADTNDTKFTPTQMTPPSDLTLHPPSDLSVLIYRRKDNIEKISLGASENQTDTEETNFDTEVMIRESKQSNDNSKHDHKLHNRYYENDDLNPLPQTKKTKNTKETNNPSQFTPTELTEEWRTIALNEGVHESWIESIYRELVEYWTGATGKKAFKKDWKATWRNWVSREATRKKYPKPASQIAEQEQTVTREFKELEEETQEAIIRRKLREKVGDASYHSWIQGLGFEIEGDTIKVYAKTAFIRDWVQREYSTLIKECSNFSKISLLIGQIEKPEEQKHSDQQRKIALIEARIDSTEHDPTLRKIRKYLLNRMGDGYERLLGHVKLYYETGYLKAYVTNVAHRSFLLNYHDTILKALDGKVKKFEVSIVERVSV